MEFSIGDLVEIKHPEYSTFSWNNTLGIVLEYEDRFLNDQARIGVFPLNQPKYTKLYFPIDNLILLHSVKSK